ncbi:MAG: hypothetical protein ACFHHU_00845 [Porticoccaceae bacterium]
MNKLAELRKNRQARANNTEQTEQVPALPKHASQMYTDALPPDVPVVPDSPAQDRSEEPAVPAKSEGPKKKPVPTAVPVSEKDMQNRVEARVSDAELAVIKQVVRKEKSKRSKQTGEPSGFNRQDLVREGLLAICRELDLEFDSKVKKMTDALKLME